MNCYLKNALHIQPLETRLISIFDNRLTDNCAPKTERRINRKFGSTLLFLLLQFGDGPRVPLPYVPVASCN